LSPPANKVARATDLPVPTASAVRAKINFQIRTAPTEWHQRCQLWERRLR